MIYTLVVYDRAAGALVKARVFGDRVRALKERFRLERAYGDTGGNLEVVVLVSRTQEDLMRTHSRYFRSLEELTNRSV